LLNLQKWGFASLDLGGSGTADDENAQNAGIGGPSDLELMHSVRAATRLDTVPPFTLLKEIMGAKGSSEFTKDVFNDALSKVISTDELGSDALDFVAYVLSTIYYSFEGESGCPDVSELFTGLCVLLSGSEIEKLAIMYDVFDSKQSGSLSVAVVTKLVRSVVTILYAMRAARLPPRDVEGREFIKRAVGTATASIVDSCVDFLGEGKTENGIAFDDFVSWYTDGGGSNALPALGAMVNVIE